MVKSELIKAVAAKIMEEQTFKPSYNGETEHVVELLIQSLQQAVAKGRRVEIRDFGVFERRIQKPRVSRNPKNGQRVEVDARPSIHFKPGKKLRERVNVALAFQQGGKLKLKQR